MTKEELEEIFKKRYCLECLQEGGHPIFEEECPLHNPPLSITKERVWRQINKTKSAVA